MDLLPSTLGEGIDLVADLDGDVPPALIDPNQLELALLNLAVNARDAMPQGGRIIILLRAAGLAEGNDLSLPAGDYVCLSISDNGTGMDAQTLARATEPFFTTKEVGKGTGLGLSMVHGLAIQSGGAFKLDSEKGQGTRAEIWLPRAQIQAPEPSQTQIFTSAAQPDEPMPPARQGAVMLVVDDDELVRHATADLLSDHGYRVVQAACGAEALALLESRSFDLLVTDLVMPGMSGVDLLRHVARLRPDLPVLVVTGHSSETGDVPAHIPRLAKPFSESDLVGSVTRLLQAQAVPS
jgi:CheY-like chemotaxis protein